MNPNLPIPVSEVTVREPKYPYIQKRKRKKSKAAFLLLMLVMIAVVAVCIISLLPGGFSGLFSGLLGSDKEQTEGSTTEGTTTTAATTNLYEFDFDRVTDGAFAILPRDLSARNVGLFIDNLAGKDGVDAILPRALDKVESGKVSVLVINTHPYEAYMASGAYEYTDGAVVNSDERARTVGAAADAFIAALEASGVGAVYVNVPTDGGRNSYASACAALEEALALYPDVQYIVDIHRDILLDEEGNMIRPVTAGENGTLAQVRLIIGTDGDGAVYENWQDGAMASLALTEALTAQYPSLMMPTEISRSRLNQHLPCTVFTVEIGTCGNSVEEAVRSAEILGAVLAGEILEP